MFKTSKTKRRSTSRHGLKVSPALHNKMLSSLSRSIVTLNEVSGAGKGEIFKKIKEEAESQGFKVHYIGSGDLYRLQKEMAAQLRTGYYPNTLDSIRDAFKKRFGEFLADFINTGGKTVLVTDGLTRRGKHIYHDTKKDEDVLIPHQIDQVAVMMKEVVREQAKANSKVHEMFPELNRWKENEPYLDELFKNTFKRANHVMIDIHPEDALELLENRARKELTRIAEQDQLKITTRHCEALSRILNGELFYDDKTWKSMKDKDGKIPKEHHESFNSAVETVRANLAKVAGLEGNATLVESFKALGIETDIRNDDISPADRLKKD